MTDTPKSTVGETLARLAERGVVISLLITPAGHGMKVQLVASCESNYAGTEWLFYGSLATLEYDFERLVHKAVFMLENAPFVGVNEVDVPEFPIACRADIKDAHVRPPEERTRWNRSRLSHAHHLLRKQMRDTPELTEPLQRAAAALVEADQMDHRQ